MVGGLNAGAASQKNPNGFLTEVQNFTNEVDGFIEPRSGLSRYGTHDFNGPVIGAFETFDINGSVGGLATSAVSVSMLHPDNQAWSDLSYIPGSLSWASGNLSGLSTDYFRSTSVFDSLNDRIIQVFSNNTDSVKFAENASATTTFSDFTWIDSFASTKAAKDVTSINDRLFLFNVLDSSGTRYPVRALWSARGNPTSFLLADGAGAEDLADMKGDGQAATRFKEFLILFTEFEIWRATPTLDDYAFRFDRVVDHMGTPWPRTIATTPQGVIFLGRDKELYITDGAGLKALGPVGGQGASRIQRKLKDEGIAWERAWGTYNQTHNRYELYYTTSDSPDAFPSRALFYSLTDETFWPQKFTLGLSAGVDLSDAATMISWDDLTDMWDATLAGWDSFDIASGNRRVNVFESKGSTLRFRSDQTTDNGDAIDVRVRPPSLRGSNRKQHLKEIWVDYQTDSASSASVFFGSNRSTPFTSPVSLSFDSSEDPIFIPTWHTDRYPAFELRLNDGGRPRIAGFTAVIQDASKF